jgi:hypothetical protein
MAYSNFSLSETIKQFNLIVQDKQDLFAGIAEIQPSPYLEFTLNYNFSLATEINTEKSRSEMIIAPILLEIRRLTDDRISLFSGREFNVAPEKGLNGACDFLISLSDSQLMINAPVVAIVEAKKEDIIGGLGQCIAEMLAAQLFNEQENNAIPIIYGVVTSGNIWRFLKLEKNVVHIDKVEYYINQIAEILAILVSMVKP